MKKILIFMFMLLPALLCRAQEEVYIDIKPNSVIYQVPANLTVPSDRRLQYDYSKAKKKKLKKGGRLLVSSLANYNRAPGYDTYIAKEKGKSYFVPIDVVKDNSFIVGINREIAEASLMLSDSLEFYKKAHESAFEGLLATAEQGAVHCWDRILGIRNNPDSILNVHVREFMDADVNRYREIRERYRGWTQTLSPETRRTAELFAITKTGLTKGSSGACDYRMEFTNLSPRSIQTLVWTGKLLDKAGNELTCTVRNRPTFTGKFTGPCPPAWPAATLWRNVAYHPDAERIQLSSVTITYTDGSRLDIDGPALQTLLSMPPEALPAGVHTESHLRDLNQFEIDHNQLLQQKKRLFRINLPDEEVLERQNLERWSELKTEISRKGLRNGSMQEILSDGRFESILGREPVGDAVKTYLETARNLDRMTAMYSQFRQDNFYE